MPTSTYVFTHAGRTVDYRITARHKREANRQTRERERAWRAAIEALAATDGSQTGR